LSVLVINAIVAACSAAVIGRPPKAVERQFIKLVGIVASGAVLPILNGRHTKTLDVVAPVAMIPEANTGYPWGNPKLPCKRPGGAPRKLIAIKELFQFVKNVLRNDTCCAGDSTPIR
jgi:hypothetical protein